MFASSVDLATSRTTKGTVMQTRSRKLIRTMTTVKGTAGSHWPVIYVTTAKLAHLVFRKEISTELLVNSLK